jgi:cystatin-A/B
VRGEVEANLGRHFSEYHAERYVTQVVAGTNYIVATKVDAAEYLHIKIHKPLPFRNLPPHLMAVRAGKTASDPLEYFE